MEHPYSIVRGLGLIVQGAGYPRETSLDKVTQFSKLFKARGSDLPHYVYNRINDAIKELKDRDLEKFDLETLIDIVTSEYTED